MASANGVELGSNPTGPISVENFEPNGLTSDAAKIRLDKDGPNATPDTGSAERDFEEQLSAMSTFFESRACIRIGNSIHRGQIDPEFVATHKSRYLIASTGGIHL